LPPVTNATREQSPDTATWVVSASASAFPGSETRVGVKLGAFARKASVWRFTSPVTRLVASERKATHFARALALPSTAGLNDGPSAGRSPSPWETSCVALGFHAEPVSPNGVARRTTNTSFIWFASPPTRSEASDSNAISCA